jgi:hypothetical protein
MIKHITLTALVILTVAASGQAYAGTIISDQRYWPSEAQRMSQPSATRPLDAFDALVPTTAQPAQADSHRYHGGPKDND